MIIFLQEVLQSQMMNLVLNIMWGDHLQNQREINLYLLCLILQKLFLQRELHLQIILQSEILLNRQLLCQDNVNPISTNSGPKTYGIMAAIINWNKCSSKSWIRNCMLWYLVRRTCHQWLRICLKSGCVLITSNTSSMCEIPATGPWKFNSGRALPDCSWSFGGSNC